MFKYALLLFLESLFNVLCHRSLKARIKVQFISTLNCKGCHSWKKDFTWKFQMEPNGSLLRLHLLNHNTYFSTLATIYAEVFV